MFHSALIHDRRAYVNATPYAACIAARVIRPVVNARPKHLQPAADS